MKRVAFVIGVLALGFAAAAPANAKYAVVQFKSGFCRVWTDTAYKPADGTWMMWRHHHHTYYNLASWDKAHARLAWEAKHKHCKYWY